MILIGLIQKYFFENMNNTQESPNHLIRVSRQDIFNIRHITTHYAMSGVNLTYCPIYLPLQLERLGKSIFLSIYFILYNKKLLFYYSLTWKKTIRRNQNRRYFITQVSRIETMLVRTNYITKLNSVTRVKIRTT
jgi:hypothetical protein